MPRFTITAADRQFSGTREGVDFKRGRASTDDRAAARNLDRRGFEVEGLGAVAAEDKPLSEMRKAELEAVAEAEGVDVSSARNNTERAELIEKARAGATTETGETDSDGE